MRTIQVHGARIAFVDEGQGALLLLLHGLGGSHDDWRLQRVEFAARYRVIVPDLRGHGASERRVAFTIQHGTTANGIRRSASIAMSWASLTGKPLIKVRFR